MRKKQTDVSSVLALVKIVVAKDNEKHLCQDLLTIENTHYSDLNASARAAQCK